jgi:hypothetical protein
MRAVLGLLIRCLKFEGVVGGGQKDPKSRF